jgi:hypothetical protein
MPVVIVAKQRAPQLRLCGGGSCRPRMLPRRLTRPPYRRLGAISRWRTQPDGHGIGSLTFAVPRLVPGPYLFGLFCDRCIRGPEGSLIIDYRLILRVR